MTSAGLRDLGRDLERLFQEGSLSGASEARLLDRFVSDRDESAFEALVARHQDMLLRTCHDLLGDAADAEEAFQATVVILMRRAGTIREKDAIGGWLHRVACRVARRSRAQAARRRASERQSAAMKRQEPVAHPEPDPLVRNELRNALHDEIDRLPDRYRQPIILCLLEGMSQEHAAARLGWTTGSVRGRLARGKARLRDRLMLKGLALAAVVAELAESPPAAAAAWPFLPLFRTKSAGAVLSALLLLGGVTLAIALQASDPKVPTSRAPSAQPAPPPNAGPKPESEALASFRGGGPTDQSRATALPPEIAARRVEFRGRVLDPSGNGVAAARLSLVTDAWSVPELQTVSGEDGSFRFTKTVGDFWRNFAKGGSAVPYVQSVILATHDSFGAAWVNLRIVSKDGKPAVGGECPLSLRMVAERPIEGRLVDEQGAPIAGAVVRVDQLYAAMAGDLSPVIEALRRFDLKPYQSSFPRIWPNNLAATMAISTVTTGADGRFTLKGVGRDRQANLSATGPGMAAISWTVLNRDDANEVSNAVRGRWPHTAKHGGPLATKAEPNSGPGVQVYGPTFDLTVDAARTVRGIVRDAMTGGPVHGALVFSSPDGATATTDKSGHYRIVRREGLDRFRLFARPAQGTHFLGVMREYDKMQAPGELTADLSLPRAIVISGRALERGTGRPMLATRNEGCHGPGAVMGGRVWYLPLAGNAALTGTEAGDYFRHGGTDPRGLFVGLVESDGVFNGAVPPGPGVLFLEASPGMPFMWQMSPTWKESDGYHRRYPYPPLNRREPADGAPREPGEAGNTLLGVFGPIALEGVVAYRVIDPTANDALHKVEITIPTAATRRVRFVDPDGRPVPGAVVFGLTASPYHHAMLDGDEIEILALDPTRERRLAALSRDGRLWVETTLRADSIEPLTVRMERSAALTGRLVDDQGNAVVGASPSSAYLSDEAVCIPLPHPLAKTDAEGRFRIEGVFPGHAITIEFHRAGDQPWKAEHYRPDALRTLVLDNGRTHDVGTVKAKSLQW